MSRLGRILPVIAVAMLGVADLQVAGWGWTASATGPSNRTLALVVVWTFAAAVGIFTIARAPRDRLARLWPLAALVGWAAISGLFGIDPARSVFAALGLAAVALAAVAAALGPGRGFLGVAVGTGVFTYASLVGDAISPADDSLFLGRFGGYASEPNVMAYIAGLFIVCGAISAAGTKRRAASAAIIAISLPAG
ncbi:MAG: hypothetical protein KDB16_19425, partial [Acidimicrobiales bacterium]|nr:hypothetical protein [Acidimicrobiales bacterium]